MKTYRHLYPQVIAFASLHAAFGKARRGKRGCGEVAAFEFDLERNLFQLQADLADHSYRPGPYHNFYIRERKLRLISAMKRVHRKQARVLNPHPSIRLEESCILSSKYRRQPTQGAGRVWLAILLQPTQGAGSVIALLLLLAVST